MGNLKGTQTEKNILTAFAGESRGGKSGAGKESGPPADLGENLDQLQRQLREMQEQLDRLSRDKG